MAQLTRLVKSGLNVALLLCGGVVTSAAFAQSVQPPPPLSFDVASVRPSEPGPQGGISRPVNGTVRVNRAPLRRIIQFAYDIDPEAPRSVAGRGPFLDRRGTVCHRRPRTRPISHWQTRGA
jgi:hypothetical protein